MEVRYLSQLKKCPYPINGVYKVHHRAARNHFRRHADIKHRGKCRIIIRGRERERDRQTDREREREILLVMAILFPAEDHRPSVYEIADDKASLQRASGWKIIHFTSQLQEMVRKKITI